MLVEAAATSNSASNPSRCRLSGGSVDSPLNKKKTRRWSLRPPVRNLNYMIEPGTEAPDFTLPDQEGEPVSLSDFRGRLVVLYFYPHANTCGS